MKRLAIILSALCVLLTACQNSKPPVVIDGCYHITLMVPESTSADDAIYIAGPLTGGEAYSLGNPQWKFTRNGNTCALTLDPLYFIGGNTLADGFWFVSEKQGRELAADGSEVTRTLNAEPGKNYQYVVASWSK